LVSKLYPPANLVSPVTLIKRSESQRITTPYDRQCFARKRPPERQKPRHYERSRSGFKPPGALGDADPIRMDLGHPCANGAPSLICRDYATVSEGQTSVCPLRRHAIRGYPDWDDPHSGRQEGRRVSFKALQARRGLQSDCKPECVRCGDGVSNHSTRQFEGGRARISCSPQSAPPVGLTRPADLRIPH